MAKPQLTVVGTARTMLEPPIPLGERGRALWDSVHREFIINDAGGIELLGQACVAADRLRLYVRQLIVTARLW